FAALQPAYYCAIAVYPPSHSSKPDEFYARVERYCDGPYVDLFAREQRPNWDCWGDQVDLFSERSIMTSRRRLADRRTSTTFSFEVGGLAYVATVSRYPDGAVGEIFLSNHKSNSTADVNARDAAIACSLALQFGADVETIRKALCRDHHGRASGPLGAALDIIARDNQYR